MVLCILCSMVAFHQSAPMGQAYLDQLHLALKEKAAVTFEVVDVSHGGKGPTVASMTIGRDGRYRQKMGQMEMIQTPEGSITLLTTKKKYSTMSFAGMTAAMYAGFDGLGDPNDYVKAEGSAEPMVWNKVNAIKVRLEKRMFGPDILYVDAVTGLPIGSEITYQKTHLAYMYKDLKLLDRIDPSVFDTNPPKGWSEQKVPGAP